MNRQLGSRQCTLTHTHSVVRMRRGELLTGESNVECSAAEKGKGRGGEMICVGRMLGVRRTDTPARRCIGQQLSTFLG